MTKKLKNFPFQALTFLLDKIGDTPPYFCFIFCTTEKEYNKKLKKKRCQHR